MDDTTRHSVTTGDSEVSPDPKALKSRDAGAFLPEANRAAPIGPTAESDLRDLRGTLNENLADEPETESREVA